MEIAASLPRLALAIVFGVAAIAKLADRPGTRRSVDEFGVPARLAPAVAALLPVAEVAIAVGLLIEASATIAGWAALALLSVFTAAATWALARGEAPDCHCFGQLRSQPVGGGMLSRNAGLAAVALLVLVVPAEAGLPAAPMLLLAGLGVAAASIAGGLLHSAGAARATRVRREQLLRGLPVGDTAPDLAVTSLAGESLALAEVLQSGSRAVLVRLSPDCGSCRPLLPEIARLQRTLPGLDVLPISTGDLDRTRLLARENGVDTMYVASADEFVEAYRLGPTPSALLIDERRRIAAAPVVGAPAVESLIRLELQRSRPAA